MAEVDTLAPHTVADLMIRLSKATPGGGDPRTLPSRQAPFKEAIGHLIMLRQPSINTAVSVMVGLDPTMQALVSDVVLALGGAGPGRQNLAIALRKLIEGRS